MAKFRQQKIDEEIKRELCSILPMLKDPRFDGVLMSVVSVIVTKDLKYAKVYISAFADEEKKKEVLKGLNNSSGFIRKEISSRTKLRYTPELNFVIDDSIEYGSHINQLINKLNGEQ